MIGKSMLLENRHWREINPVQCGWQECEPGHAFGPSARTHYLLHYVVSGKGHFTVRNRRYTLGPGQSHCNQANLLGKLGYWITEGLGKV